MLKNQISCLQFHSLTLVYGKDSTSRPDARLVWVAQEERLFPSRPNILVIVVLKTKNLNSRGSDSHNVHSYDQIGKQN